MAIVNSQGLTYQETLDYYNRGVDLTVGSGPNNAYGFNSEENQAKYRGLLNDFYVNLGAQSTWNNLGFSTGGAFQQIAAGLDPFKSALADQTVQMQYQIGGANPKPPPNPSPPAPNITYPSTPATPPSTATSNPTYSMAIIPTTQAPQAPQNVYGQVLTLPSGQRVSPQDPNYSTYASQLGVSAAPKVSAVPVGATLISGPSGLKGLTESQIYRDPNSANIYKLAQQPPMDNNPPSSGDLPGGTTNYTPPTPEANNVSTGYINTLNQDLANTRKALEDAYQKQLKGLQDQMAASQAKIDSLNTTQQGILEQDVKPLTEPFRQQYETSERQRLQVEQNYFENQNLTNELQSLLTEGNTLVEQMRGVTGLSSIRNPRITEAINGVNARAGVIQAVMSARNDQIAQAYTLIDRGIAATTADRQDQLNYYESLYNFYEGQKTTEGNKLITLTASEKGYIDSQISLLTSDLESAQTTADYIKSLMVNPDTALTLAKSGVTLNDTVEQINLKLAKYAEVQQIQDEAKAKKEQEASYVQGLMTKYPDAGIIFTDSAATAQAKSKTSKIYAQATRLAGGGSGGGGTAYTPTEKKKLEQAGLTNAPRQEQLDYLYSKDSANNAQFYVDRIKEGSVDYLNTDGTINWPAVPAALRQEVFDILEADQTEEPQNQAPKIGPLESLKELGGAVKEIGGYVKNFFNLF